MSLAMRSNKNKHKTKWCILLCSVGTIFIGVFIFGTVIIVKNAKNHASSKDLCVTSECLKQASNILKYLNTVVNPCEDFYEFTCGNYLRNTIIRDDISQHSSLTTISDKIYGQLTQFMEKPLSENASKSNIFLKKMYNACLDTTTSPFNEIGPRLQSLTAAASFPLTANTWNKENYSFIDVIRSLRVLGFPHDIFFSIYTDYHNTLSEKFRVYGTCKKHFYMDKVHYQVLLKLLSMVGANKDVLKQDLEDVMRWREKFHRICSNSSSQSSSEIKVVNALDLITYFSINWEGYILAVTGLPRTFPDQFKIALKDVISFRGTLELCNKMQSRVQANFIFIETLAWLYMHLPATRKLLGNDVLTPKKCTKIISNSMDVFVNILYVKNHFTTQSVMEVDNFLQIIKNAFKQVLSEAQWVSSLSLLRGKQKLETLSEFVTYPDFELLTDKYLDTFYGKLNPNFKTFAEAVMMLYRFNKKLNFYQLSFPFALSQSFDIYRKILNLDLKYVLSNNMLIIPTALIQHVAFDRNRPNYLNYGILGSLLGRTIIHGFDDTDSYNFKKLNFSIWDNHTRDSYKIQARCVKDNYKNYTVPDINLTINPNLVVHEHIADVGSLKTAYLAYSNWTKYNVEDEKIPGMKFTSNQMFWISFAHFYCSYDKTDHLREELLSHYHAPNKFRVLAALSNMNEFLRDFECSANSGMRMQKTCLVW